VAEIGIGNDSMRCQGSKLSAESPKRLISPLRAYHPTGGSLVEKGFGTKMARAENHVSSKLAANLDDRR
jgi:hypothetical protein